MFAFPYPHPYFDDVDENGETPAQVAVRQADDEYCQIGDRIIAERATARDAMFVEGCAARTAQREVGESVARSLQFEGWRVL